MLQQKMPQFFEFLNKKSMKNVSSLDINLLSPSKANSKIYSKRKVDVLANSMHKYGQLEPIVINKENVIQSGVLRWEAAK